MEPSLEQGDVERLAAVSSRTGLSVAALIATLDRATADTTVSEVTEAERMALAAAGIRLATGNVETAGAIIAGTAASRRLYDSALTVEQAAQRLGVTTGRIRQRISAGVVAVVRRREGYLLPAWQFYGDTVVPHLKQILATANELHPLTLQGFMTTPNPDLEVDGEIVSPREWLVTGGDPKKVAELVETLYGQM